MITLPILQTGTATQTAGGSGISWELVVLLGIAAVVVIALAWLFLNQSSGSAD